MDLLESRWQYCGDVPLSRFGHTATMLTENQVCIFGGAIGSMNNVSMTDSTYTLNLITMEWKKIQSTGIIPSARAAHGAACFEKNKIAIYGGATQKGLASDQLFILDVKKDVGIWNIVNVKNKTPGKRYAHNLVYKKPYLVVIGGNLENNVTNDVWVLDIQNKPLIWSQIKFAGEAPQPRDYHSASLCTIGSASGMIVLFGGRSAKRQPINDCWGLVKHVSSGEWQWVKAPIKQQPKPRYQHSSLFMKNLMLIVGGKSNNSTQDLPLQAYDISTNRWLFFQYNIQRFRQVSWVFENNLYILGGLSLKNKQIDQNPMSLDLKKLFFGNDVLLNSLTNQLRSSNVSQKSSTSKTSTKALSIRRDGSRQKIQQFSPIRNQISAKTGNSNLVDKNLENNSMISSKPQKRRPMILDPVYYEVKSMKPQKSLSTKSDIAQKFLNLLMNPRIFSRSQSPNIQFHPDQIISLCDQAQQIIASQPMLLDVKAPLKIFGDIHGQFSDLMSFFQIYGAPHENGQRKDIQNYDYVFLGDYVDRGNHSLQTICLLLALKIVYPNQMHLLRGNHEDIQANTDFGFKQQVQQKIDEEADDERSVYMRINRLFQWLPLAARAQNQILCLHGGIGKGLKNVEQILQIKRPLQIVHEVSDRESQLVLDILWSDPTQSDQIFGIHNNYPRNPKAVQNEVGDIVRFGPDRVHSFLKQNNLKMIIRAHECVMDGFQRFAGGALITVFSATDYCRRHKNAGAILILKTNLQLIPKIIYPKQANANTWLDEDSTSYKRGVTPPRWRTTR